LAASEAAPPSSPAPDPETVVAAAFETLIVVLPPPIVIPLDALTPNAFAECVSSDAPLPVTPSVVPTLSAFECMITLVFAITSMSPSDSILTILLTESRTILFFFVLSTMVTFSAPSLSSKMIRWPLRDLMSLVLFFPDALTSTGSCFLLHSAPMTIGRSTSPCSNTTSSWSSISGST
jgi:hypothetical protein